MQTKSRQYLDQRGSVHKKCSHFALVLCNIRGMKVRALKARPWLHLEHYGDENDYEAWTMYNMINCDDTKWCGNYVIFPIRTAVLRRNSCMPGIANRTFGNRTQSNPIRRLSSAIEPNRTPKSVWVRFPSQSNSTEQIEPNRTQSIRLCSIEFGNWTQSNSINRSMLDCVRWMAWTELMLCGVTSRSVTFRKLW